MYLAPGHGQITLEDKIQTCPRFYASSNSMNAFVVLIISSLSLSSLNDSKTIGEVMNTKTISACQHAGTLK